MMIAAARYHHWCEENACPRCHSMVHYMILCTLHRQSSAVIIFGVRWVDCDKYYMVDYGQQYTAYALMCNWPKAQILLLTKNGATAFQMKKIDPIGRGNQPTLSMAANHLPTGHHILSVTLLLHCNCDIRWQSSALSIGHNTHNVTAVTNMICLANSTVSEINAATFQITKDVCVAIFIGSH